jgi:predicted permease
MKRFKKILSLVAVLSFVLGLSALVPASSKAATLNEGVCDGINTVVGGDNCTDGAEAQDTLKNTINQGINLFSIIVGAASVIMIIYGGFKYITSGGSDDATKSAKNTILYALVGLIIVLVAQTIVKFVFGKAVQLNSDSSE